MGLIDGKVALVTGAGTGIGREAAILLAREGATVVLSGRRAGPLEDVAAMIAKEGGRAVRRPLDERIASAIFAAVAGWRPSGRLTSSSTTRGARARC